MPCTGENIIYLEQNWFILPTIQGKNYLTFIELSPPVKNAPLLELCILEVFGKIGEGIIQLLVYYI